MIETPMLSSLLGLVLLIPATLFQIALWQRKEYRLDRVWAYVISQESSLFIHSRYLLFGYGALGVSWLLYVFAGELAANAFGWIALLLFTVHHGIRTRRQGLIRPKLTLKAIAAIIGLLVLAHFYLRATFVATSLPATQWATLHFFLPLLAALAVGLINIPFGLRKMRVVKQATAKRQGLSNLTVIGITGSYGKTSTKYFLSQLLTASKKRILTTPEHCNSYYCVAKHIVSGLSEKTDIYIAEMAAYRRGEIKQIAEITQPTAGIITAIGNQHVSLFGSLEEILDTKWELAQALPEHGTLILNGDDARLVTQAKQTNQKKILYSVSRPTDIWAENVHVQATSTNCQLHIMEKTFNVTTPVVSEGLLSSVVAAVSGAYVLGMPAETIAQSLTTLKPMPATMQLRPGINESLGIDDSYSGGEAAALNAIHHLSRFTQTDKRIVFIPIIELGAEAARVHEKIGQALAASGARIYVYGLAHQADIQRGAGDLKKFAWFTDPLVFTETITQHVTKETVILLEGRVPKVLHQALFI